MANKEYIIFLSDISRIIKDKKQRVELLNEEIMGLEWKRKLNSEEHAQYITGELKLFGKVYNKWEQLGLLTGLTINSKIKLANAYEYVANTLNTSESGEFNSQINTLAFPLLRRIMDIQIENSLNEEFLDEYLNKLSKFTETYVYIEAAIQHQNVPNEHIDAEAELLLKFIEDYDK